RTNTLCSLARSRADGVMIVRSPITILRPRRTAWRTSSSHTNDTTAPDSAGGTAVVAVPVTVATCFANAAVSTPDAAAGGATFGKSVCAAGAGVGTADADACVVAGRSSYARRLMLSKCFGEMLSDVILPPQPPHPSVIDGSRPVVSPIDPCVVGVFTTIRKAGFFNPNSRMT